MRLLAQAEPSTIDSLSAFFPSVQVLAGDLESAIKGHLLFWNMWKRYSALPESWDWVNRKMEWAGWPGRPEFIESTYYLYKVSRMRTGLSVGDQGSILPARRRESFGKHQTAIQDAVRVRDAEKCGNG
jgi:mannosidase alpha-like ER degradation enhancer 1